MYVNVHPNLILVLLFICMWNAGKVYICVLVSSLGTNNIFLSLVEQAIFEKNKNIEELQLLVTTAKKERTELQTLLDEERR